MDTGKTGWTIGDGFAKSRPFLLQHGPPYRPLAHALEAIEHVVEHPVGLPAEGLPIGGIECPASSKMRSRRIPAFTIDFWQIVSPRPQLAVELAIRWPDKKQFLPKDEKTLRGSSSLDDSVGRRRRRKQV